MTRWGQWQHWDFWSEEQKRLSCPLPEERLSTRKAKRFNVSLRHPMGNTKWGVAYMSLEHRGETRAGDRNMSFGAGQSYETTVDHTGSECWKKWVQGRRSLRDLKTYARSTRKTEKEAQGHGKKCYRIPHSSSLVKECLHQSSTSMVRRQWLSKTMDSDVRWSHLEAYDSGVWGVEGPKVWCGWCQRGTEEVKINTDSSRVST